jgi:diguanylate cyclase (GGDEF)-like protein
VQILESPIAAKILLVEDNAVEAAILIEAVRRIAPEGYEFAVVPSLRAALRALRFAPVDCVLIDYNLPGTGGAAAVAAVRDAASGTPLVAFTALGDRQAPIEAIRAGADDCLEKRGFDARQLCRSVDMSIERGVARRQLLGLALRDPMTGLGNWAQFHESLTRATARAGRSGQLMALIYIDLDGFKQVNDALGHDAGDVLLKAVAARFSSQLRAGDLLARIGGDEFGLILENLPHAQCATVVARKLLASLEAPVLIGHEEVCVGASIGIAIRPADGLDAKDLLRAADSAMYLAKRQGGTRICSPSDLLSGAGATDLPRSALGEPMDATPQLRAVRPAEPERAQLG